jgi:tetraacyldisaccharide 4'-kinase
VKVLKLFLFPLGILFGLMTEIRRWLYKIKVFKRVKPTIASFGIGNLSVGGTGKTPVSMYLIKLLEENSRIAFISRGYKRSTKGQVEASELSTWKEIGDEPFLVKRIFPKTKVIVDEKRVRALKFLEKKEQNIDVLIFDDVLQHFRVKTGFQILLTEYSKPFYNDRILPVGRLREFKKNAQYSDVVIMTKCPSILSPIERRHLEHQLGCFTKSKVFFSSLVYSPLISLETYLSAPINNNQTKKIQLSQNYVTIGVCGIGNPFSFEEYLRRNSAFASLMAFPDHHEYDRTDLLKIKQVFDGIRGPNKIIVITEKDAVKLGTLEIVDEVKNLPMFVLPVEVKFDGNDQNDFEKLIHEYVEQNKRIS